VKSHLFSIIKWESKAIPQEIAQWLSNTNIKTDDEVQLVTDYFSSIKRIKALQSEIEAVPAANEESDLTSLEVELNQLQEQTKALTGTVERIIEKQIRDVLTEQGIFNPIIEARISFPPINFKLEKPPYLLVISPRENIDTIREITLIPSLTLEEIEGLEFKVDELGVSSLVVKLGGLGATYPTFVTKDASLSSTIEITIEEWLHQYLVFKPLGFAYLLDQAGLSRNYEIATINETLASMVSNEIGSIVYEKYYADHENATIQNHKPTPGFDFNQEMREIRRTVDSYLGRGEIERAEDFMEQKRQYLASKNHYIRKLNQAYFAFHGTYADSPTSISPIGAELKQLRAQSSSLKDFLNIAASIASRQDLKYSVD